MHSIVCIGEVLWDVLSTGKVLGGAPANVAWHAAQLGVESHIISAVGNDPSGAEILDQLAAMHMDISGIATIDAIPTSMVDAQISDDGVASYVIRQNVAWDYIPITEHALDLVRRADALNFGSLAQRTDPGHHMIATFLDAAKPDCLKMFDINLRPGCMRKDVLEACFSRCDVIKLNAEELLVVAELFNWPGRAEKALERILETHPGVGHVIVTRGADGVWWQTRNELLKREGREVRIADTIGAGDSLTATVLVGMLRGGDPGVVLDMAVEVSSFVCTQVGATPVLPRDIRQKMIEMDKRG